MGNHYHLTLDVAIEALRAVGFEHLDNMPTSGSGRIPARGKPPNNRSASVSWTADGQALHWMDFTTSDKGTVFANYRGVYDKAESSRRFTDAEHLRRRAESERVQQQQRVAQLSRNLWARAVSTGRTPYIDSKQLDGLHNARIEGDTLVVPIWAPGLGFANLQRIRADGSKRFLTGGRVKGAFSVLGDLNGVERILICEGWATGATLFEQFGYPVFVAFNAGNLMPVCQWLRSRFSAGTLVVAGDDDRLAAGNPGRTKAIEAAETIGCQYMFPDLCERCPCTDYNDAAACARRCARG